jgi:hypothetical protein
MGSPGRIVARRHETGGFRAGTDRPHPQAGKGRLVRLGHRPVAVVALTAALALAAGCGEGEPAEGPLGGETASASPSESPSATATAPAVPQARADTRANREAFARWFVDAFAYAFATNDVEPILDVAATEEKVKCSTCEAFADFIGDREAKGLTLQPSEYRVRRVFETGKVGDVHVLTMITDRPAYANVDEDGTRSGAQPRDKAYPIEVGLRYHQGKYELTGWTAGEGDEESS